MNDQNYRSSRSSVVPKRLPRKYCNLGPQSGYSLVLLWSWEAPCLLERGVFTPFSHQMRALCRDFYRFWDAMKISFCKMTLEKFYRLNWEGKGCRKQNQLGNLQNGPSESKWGPGQSEAVGTDRQNEVRGGRARRRAQRCFHPPPSGPVPEVQQRGKTMQSDKERCGWPWNNLLRYWNCGSFPIISIFSHPTHSI